MSLKHQIRVESGTCKEIIASGLATGVITPEQATGLSEALEAAIAPSLGWVEDDAARLADPDGVTVYHDVARALSITTLEARRRLQESAPGATDNEVIEDLIWRSARRLDSVRARDLTHVIHTASAS